MESGVKDLLMPGCSRGLTRGLRGGCGRASVGTMNSGALYSSMNGSVNKNGGEDVFYTSELSCLDTGEEDEALALLWTWLKANAVVPRIDETANTIARLVLVIFIPTSGSFY